MDIRIYKNFDKEIEILWKELELRSEITPFQTYTWLENWYKTIGSPIFRIEPNIVCLFNGNQLEALLPLGVKKIGSIKVLEWLGGIVTDYMCPIIDPNSKFFKDNFLTIWEEVKDTISNYDAIHLSKQKPYIGIEKNPFSHFLESKFMMNSRQSFFKKDWDEYKKLYIKQKFLRDSRRRRRRLSELGNLEFKVFDSESDLSELIDTMFQQKSRRYEEKEGWDIFKINEYREFYKEIPKILNKDHSVHISALLLDDVIIATHWGLISPNTFFHIMPTQEGGNLSKYSVGRLLLESLMEWCSNSKISYFDFTGGEELYKKEWSNESFELTEVLESNSLKGRLYILTQLFKSYFRDMPIIGRALKKLYNFLRIT